MTAQVEDWEQTTPDPIKRDTWGRPMIIPPGGGKPVAYTRCTTFVGALEDTYNLGRWQQRMVAVGLSARPDLLLKVSSLGPEPPKLVPDPSMVYVTNPRFAPWRAAMDETTEQALEAAAAHAKATVGTALHKLAERMDLGEDTGIVPVEYLPHLGAYAHATDGWSHLAVERFVVCDELKVGGTPDRISYVPGLGLVVADLKTGDTTYGQLKFAQQLAVYAHSQFYDPATGERTPMPNGLDLRRGLIIGLDALTGTCELLEVDIARGWEAVQVSADVRKWRAKRALAKPWTAPVAPPSAPEAGRPPVASGKPQAAHQAPNSSSASTGDQAVLGKLQAGIQAASTVDQLTELWRKHRREWTGQLTDLAAKRRAELEGGGTGADGPHFRRPDL